MLGNAIHGKKAADASVLIYRQRFDSKGPSGGPHLRASRSLEEELSASILSV